MGKISINANPIVRHDVEADASKFKWGTQFLAHISRYQKAAELIVCEAQRLGRPVDVASIGCGMMGELRYLVGGLYVKKSDVLRSYVGIDVEHMQCPLGDRLRSEIEYRFVQQDIEKEPRLPIGDCELDVAVCLEIVEHMGKEAAQAWIEDLSFCMRNDGVAYFSTPNSDYSHRSNAKYHPYEWSLDELLQELERYWKVEVVAGSFINMDVFSKANEKYGRVPIELVDVIAGRFDAYWRSAMLAVAYPEFSKGVEIIVRVRR